jgi:hypothetical protein
MTDTQWLLCSEPERMLAFLRRCGRCAGERKLRLFACACCRVLPDRLVPAACRAALATAELHADGRCSAAEWAAAQADARAARRAAVPARHPKLVSAWVAHKAAEAVASALAPWAWDAAITVMPWAEDARVGLAPWEMGIEVDLEERRRVGAELRCRRENVRACHAGLLREVFGPSPARPLRIDSAWLAWQDATLVKLAAGIYEEQAYDRLPILADALEDAGCTDEPMLAHARHKGAREHVRGCWLLDALLGNP